MFTVDTTEEPSVWEAETLKKEDISKGKIILFCDEYVKLLVLYIGVLFFV